MQSERILFLSDGKINELKAGKAVEHISSAAESYVRNVKEINAKNAWKKRGAGAMFTGVQLMQGEEDVVLPCVTGLAATEDGKLAYAVNTGSTAGIYVKDLAAAGEKDGFILTKRDVAFFDLDAHNGRMVTTVAENGEVHLAVVSADGGSVSACTEGDCRDGNPKWSRFEEDVLLYDSCGLGFDGNLRVAKIGPSSVYRLHIRTGALEEVLEGGVHDYICPYEAQDGTIYCIRRPHREPKSAGMSLMDVLLFPVRLLKAIFGFLNFFTQRYAGESLKTSGGQNPAKSRQKSEEQLFVEGNLLAAEKNMKENAARGEKNAGYAPSSWELIAKRADGRVEVLRKGVLNFCVGAEGRIVFSNGKYIIAMDGASQKEETLLGAAYLGRKLTMM